MARIAHVSETLATGVLSVIATLAARQALDGHEVLLFGSRVRSDTPPNWREGVPESVRFVDVPMQREIDPRADLAAALRLGHELGRHAPDVVHLHSSKAGALGRLACARLPAKVVYQPHGLSYLRRDVTDRTRGMYVWMERLLALLGGTVVACSEGERDALRGVVSSSRAALVPNGVDLSAIARARAHAGAARVRVGTCGRISAQKRPAFFAEVARAVGDAADFVWIGDGEADGRELLRRAGARVTGWCSRADAIAHVSELQIYVQTSAWEGMPVSVIEAMAAGLPVVATDIVGNRDLLRGSGAGTLVSTPDEMARAVRNLVDNAEERRRIGDVAWDLAHRRHSAETMADRYYRIYGLEAPRRTPAR